MNFKEILELKDPGSVVLEDLEINDPDFSIFSTYLKSSNPLLLEIEDYYVNYFKEIYDRIFDQLPFLFDQNIAIVQLSYVLRSNSCLHDWLKKLILKEKSSPYQGSLQMLYLILIKNNFEDLIHLSSSKWDGSFSGLIYTYTQRTNSLFLEISWLSDSASIFEFILNLCRTKFPEGLQSFLEKFESHQTLDSYVSSLINSLNVKGRQSMQKKEKDIYQKFIINDLLPHTFKLIEHPFISSKRTYGESMLCNLACYSIETYSYSILNQIFNYREPTLDNDKEKEKIIITCTKLQKKVVDIIILNHRPAMWKLFLQELKESEIKTWKLILQWIIDGYFDALTIWKDPKPRNWRYSFICYIKKFFQACPEKYHKELVSIYKGNFGKEIDLPSFLSSLPSGSSLMKKLPIDWSSFKPYLVYAYRFSDCGTIKWLWSKLKDRNPSLIDAQDFCVGEDDYNIHIIFNPILAALANPNLKVLKEVIKDYQRGAFDCCTDGNMDWFERTDDYMKVLFDNSTTNIRYSLKKLKLILPILEEKLPGFGTTSMVSYLSKLTCLAKTCECYHLGPQFKEGIEAIIKLSGINVEDISYALIYKELYGTFHLKQLYKKSLRLKDQDHKTIVFELECLELFLNHPLSKLELLTDEDKINIWGDHILEMNICQIENPILAKLQTLLPISVQKPYLNFQIRSHKLSVECYLFNELDYKFLPISFSPDIKEEYLESFQTDIMDRQTEIVDQVCPQCSLNVSECFKNKFQILKKNMNLDFKDYKNIFSFQLHCLYNRSIVRFLLEEGFSSDCSYLTTNKHIPYPPDIVEWQTATFTMERFLIRRRLKYKRNHSKKMKYVLNEIVFRPPLDDAFKEMYPVLANGSRIYQLGYVNFYRTQENLSSLNDDQDQLIKSEYFRLKDIDHQKRIKKRRVEENT